VTAPEPPPAAPPAPVVRGARRAGRWWRLTQAGPAIYGTIIGASVMASVEEHTPVHEVAEAVIVTLLIYWLAERWSVLLGTHLAGEPIDWRHAREVFADGWPMVQASYAPLVVMLLASAAGASSDLAVSLALLGNVVSLVALGTLAGRRAGLRGLWLLGAATFTGMLGVLLIILKAVLSH
jgi:hypothetical protein